MPALRVMFELPMLANNVDTQEDRDKLEQAILAAVEGHMNPEPMMLQATWITEEGGVDHADGHLDHDRYRHASDMGCPVIDYHHMGMRVLQVRIDWDD